MGQNLMRQSCIVQPRGMGEGIVWKDRTAEHIDYGCYSPVALADNDIFLNSMDLTLVLPCTIVLEKFKFS